MFSLLKGLISRFLPVKVYALVGRSGTGKSFRAQNIAAKYRIPLIIDDGLLIRGDKIVAGKSAKQETNFLTAVKCAVFMNPDHRAEVIEALDHESFHKILIIGTSENMTNKIAAVLNLPAPSKVIKIEDVATAQEIETAMRIRFTEGKHVIPVSPLQITRTYPRIVYDAVRSLTRKRPGSKPVVSEKTLVRPEFSQAQETRITETVLRQMIGQSLYEYGNTLKIENVSFDKGIEGYNISVILITPNVFDESQRTALQTQIHDSLEKYGGILVRSVSLEIQHWA